MSGKNGGFGRNIGGKQRILDATLGLGCRASSLPMTETDPYGFLANFSERKQGTRRHFGGMDVGDAGT